MTFRVSATVELGAGTYRCDDCGRPNCLAKAAINAYNKAQTVEMKNVELRFMKIAVNDCMLVRTRMLTSKT